MFYEKAYIFSMTFYVMLSCLFFLSYCYFLLEVYFVEIADIFDKFN